MEDMNYSADPKHQIRESQKQLSTHGAFNKRLNNIKNLINEVVGWLGIQRYKTQSIYYKLHIRRISHVIITLLIHKLDYEGMRK